MKKKMYAYSKMILIALVILVVLSACGAVETGSSPNNSDMMIDKSNMMIDKSEMKNKGKASPMFTLSDLDDNQIQLAEFNGHKVYVKYWASWCTICLAGLEDLNTLAGQNNDFEVITIVTPNYKGEKSTEDFTEWYTKQPYNNLTVLFDEDGEWAKKFGLRAYPSSYYIGSDGVLVKSAPGHADNETIIETFNEIL